jgi:Glycosyl transferase family 11
VFQTSVTSLRHLALRPAARQLRRVWPRPELTVRFRPWGLGNQLFQLAGSYAIASRRGVSMLVAADWPYREFFSVPHEWFVSSLSTRRCIEAWEFATAIDPVWRPHLQDVTLWAGFERTVHAYFQPSERVLERVRSEFRDLVDAPSTTAVHVRRGDFLDSETLPRPCPFGFYEQAFATVAVDAPSTQFVVFSDDIAWCQRKLPLKDAVFVSGNPNWLDMALMSRCDHHICANSTFSWWGAFLSENPRPIAPWLTGVLPESFRQMYPPRWRLVEVAPDPGAESED